MQPHNGTSQKSKTEILEKLGQANVDSFMRFYVTPGANHGGTGVSSLDGTALANGVDLLEAIDKSTQMSVGTARCPMSVPVRSRRN
jgi:hypothetical protein